MSKPMPVAVAAVRKQDFEEWITLSGTATPQSTVTIRSLVDGQLEKVYFADGKMLHAGDLVAQIDPRPYQIALDQARAALARDEALLANAITDLARYKTLLKGNSIAEQQVATQAALVDQYKATTASDRATIANAELQLDYTKISSPITGLAGIAQINPGNMIHATDANGLVIVTQMDPMDVIFAVPQERVAALRKRLDKNEVIPVEALDKGMKTSLGRGQLTTSDNQIDLASGTLKLKAEIPNTDGVLFPNQFVIVRLLVDSQPGATVAPSSAIQRGAKGDYAFVINEGDVVTLRTLLTGSTHGDDTLIIEGLKPGDRVVTQGVDRLREGARVKIILPDAAPASAGKNKKTSSSAPAVPE